MSRRIAERAALGVAEMHAAFSGPDGPGLIAAAARAGLVEAQVLLGQLHLDERVPTHPGLAYRWFAAAAGAGHPPGINMQGRCLEHGWGVPADPAAAVLCYRRAAEAGLDWAQFNLASALLNGIGGARDRIAAHGWFVHAAAQGHAKAANMLGRFHEEGWDRPRCRITAAHFYREAAAGGDERGMFNLASLLHRQGRVAEALPWLRRAMDEGCTAFRAEAAALLAGCDDPAIRAIVADHSCN